jgi:hypothetical protein
MTTHRVYREIVAAVEAGQLAEPFSAADVCRACPGIPEGTPGTFLPKHRWGNPGGNTELFERVGRGRYRLPRPLRYGL